MEDKFEPKPHWDEQSEGEQELARAGAALYAQALQKRRLPGVPDQPVAGEELEALSQELKLRQKCQDIAAQIMVDDLMEGELDGEME